MKTCKGLTLNELIIVIAIILLITAILLPLLLGARESSRSQQCISNLAQLGKAFLLYLHDWDETFPSAGDLNAEPGIAWVARNPESTHWQALPEKGALFQYVRNVEVYICPSDPLGRQVRLSYSMNSSLGYIDPLPVRYGQIANPSTLVLLTETHHTGYWEESFAGSSCEALSPTTALPCPSDPIPCSGMMCLPILACYHAGEKTNALFCEGHVRGFPRGTLQCRFVYRSLSGMQRE